MPTTQKSHSLRPKIGLALGSGSARGWSHIGVIEALLEEKIKPDIICGCSIGALVGAAYVAGKLDYLKEWTLSLTKTRIIRLLDISLSHGGIINGDLISRFLLEMHGEKDIQQYSIPFAAIATDLMTGREIWLQEGSIQEAVRASISIPGIFTPVKISDRWLIDGGLVNPVPVSVCRALGADIIIAVNLNGDVIGRRGVTPDLKHNEGRFKSFQRVLHNLTDQIPETLKEQALHFLPNLLQPSEDTPGYFDVLFNSLNIMQDRITRSRLAGDPPHVMLVPRLANFNLMDFSKAKEAIEEGRSCVKHSLSLLRKFL